jgi:hypothetical protein
MVKQNKFDLNGQKLTARELTVEQIYNHLNGAAELPKGPAVFYDRLFPERIPFAMARESVGEEDSFWASLAPSDYDELLREVEKVNHFLSAMMCRVAKFQEEVLNKAISSGLSAK